jgi:S1-C subfamily serine protease
MNKLFMAAYSTCPCVPRRIQREGLYGKVKSMRMNRASGFLTACITSILFFSTVVSAQVPNTVLWRVFYLKTQKGTGTGFTLDRNGNQYLITARHVVEGLSERAATLQIYRSADWHNLTANILYPSNPEVDIAVLQLPQPLRTDAPVLVPDGGAGIYVSQEVFFVGFPEGAPHVYVGSEFPIAFIKHGILSAIEFGDTKLWYVDGFNNPGFSGGPIVFQDSSTHEWKVGAVVQSYRVEAAKTRIGKNLVDTPVLVNSGILIGYNIEYAVKVIDGIRSAKK